MEEAVNQKIVSMTFQTRRAAGRALRDVINMYYRHKSSIRANAQAKRTEKKARMDPLPQKMKIKELVGTGRELRKVELKDDDIKSFEKIARKYGVHYSIQKDRATDPPTYYFFFQAKDAEVIDRAFKSFLNKDLNKKKTKPVKDKGPKKISIKAAIEKYKVIVEKSKAALEKDRNKEKVR